MPDPAETPLAPQAGAPTSQRLYFLPMLGVAPLLAILITSWWSAGGARRFTARALAVTTVFVSGISCLGMSTWFGTVTRDVREIIVDADVGPDAEGTREALVLNSPTEFAQLVPITTWVVETGDRTLRWWPLQLGKRALRWTRTGDATFELAIAADTAPPFGEGPVERVLIASDRVDDATLAARRWRTALFDVEPVRVDDGVRTARFTLSRSLDDPSIRFLAWDGERLARIAPPAIGATIELAAVPPLMPMMP